ncbi:MAG: methyltransferase domain-containing protein [Clostridium sp.]
MGKIFFEEEYDNKKGSVFGQPSKEVVEIIDRLDKNSLILDVGCGDGRHSVYAAKKGHRVHAFDLSESAVENLKSKIAGLDIIVSQKAIKEYVFKETYDLIIVHGVLQFIEKDEREAFLIKMKENTKINGYNILAIFTDSIELPKDLEKYLIGVFKENEIKKYYSDFETILFESYIFEDEHDNGVKHKHAINKLVARKFKR